MAEPPHTKDRGRLYWEAQIFGPNPFPSDDPRHGWWRQMAAWAAEADERLDAAIRLRNQDGRGDSWPVDLFVGRLDIIAEALLRSSVRDFEDAAKFKAVLAAAADQFLGAVQSMTMPYVQKESLVWDLRSTLSQRSAYWFAEALKVAREAEEQLAQNPVASAPHPSRREAAAVARTAVEPEAATRPFPVSEFDLNSADGRRKAIDAFLEAATTLAGRGGPVMSRPDAHG